MIEKKRIKTKSELGYFVKTKIVEMYDNTREGGIRKMSKDLMVCV